MSEYRAIQSEVDATGLRAAIIVSRYHEDVVEPMFLGASECFVERGGSIDDVVRVPAPGAFELPTIASACIDSGRFDVLVVLGCLIKGETRHDEVIADAVAREIAHLGAAHKVAIGFGVLTVQNKAQAAARGGGSMGNKGAQAMQAALETHGVLRSLGVAAKERV